MNQLAASPRQAAITFYSVAIALGTFFVAAITIVSLA